VSHDVTFEQVDRLDAGADLYVERLQRALSENLGDLTALESRILAQRFPPETRARLTLKEIGDATGLSKERIRQIQNNALRKLREVLDADAALQ
jgi:RNA polymerase primary sigma factor